MPRQQGFPVPGQRVLLCGTHPHAGATGVCTSETVHSPSLGPLVYPIIQLDSGGRAALFGENDWALAPRPH